MQILFFILYFVGTVFSNKLAIKEYTLKIANFSSGETIFRTSTEFIRMECGSQIHPAHIRISEPSDACQRPNSVIQLPAQQWALLVTGDDGCSLRTKFINAALAGYSAIILATSEKLSSVMNILIHSGVWHLDVYLVNPWDVLLISQHAYPQTLEYSTFVVPTPNVGTGEIESEDPQFCETERKKPYYERVYYKKHISIVTALIEYCANFLTRLLRLLVALFDLERLVWISLVVILWFYKPASNYYNYWAVKLEIKTMSRKYKVELHKIDRERKQAIKDKIREHKAQLDREYQKRVEAVKTLSDLQHHFYDFLDNRFQCSICKEVFLDVVKTACKHRFCGGCLKRWRWENQNCPLCRYQFSEEEKPTPCKVLNAHLEKLFTKLPPEMMKERILKQKAFKMMKRPKPNEHVRRFDRIPDFVEHVFNQDGGENRRIPIQLPNENGNGELEEYVQISRNEEGVAVYQYFNEPEDSSVSGIDALVETQHERNNNME